MTYAHTPRKNHNPSFRLRLLVSLLFLFLFGCFGSGFFACLSFGFSNPFAWMVDAFMGFWAYIFLRCVGAAWTFD